MTLSDDISTVPFIGAKYQQLLEKLEIHTIEDLIYHVPTRYNDTSHFFDIKDLSRDEARTIKVTIDSLRSIRLRNGKTLQKGLVSDDTDQIEVTWFNQPYLTNALQEGDTALLHGKLDKKSLLPKLVTPQFEKESNSKSLHLGRIVPHYSLTRGVSLKWIRRRIFELIKKIDSIEGIEVDLPKQIITKYSLIDKKEALKKIHFPELKQEVVESRRRLAFDELLDIQKILLAKRKSREKLKAQVPVDSTEVTQKFIKSLPFTLTESQAITYKKIHQEYQEGRPIRRIIQGDVGSGKTVVAALASIPLLESKKQVVLLAPTSVLANQHFESLSTMLPKYKIGLITSNSSKSDKSNPDFDLIIGTHAIFYHQEKLLHRLGLIIIDEQHRFGVKQRSQLSSIQTSQDNSHLIQLTATPIPRSIALSLFGDYEVSYIEKPSMRRPVDTLLTPESKREASYTWVKNKIHEQGQAFWIVPLIEENEEINAKAIISYENELKEALPDLKIKILHGQMKSAEKDKILNDFKAKKFDILLSTTVVEVGIDIPDANIIVIEDAHRFGLAQLHQLRGRVGRKNQESWCLLFFDAASPEAQERLRFFSKENNGLKIAEYDLGRRGPGEVYGTAQSGIPLLKVAKFSNLELLNQTREAAELLYK